MTVEDRRKAGQPADPEGGAPIAAGEAIRASGQADAPDAAASTASKAVWQLLPDMATGGGPEAGPSSAAPIELDRETIRRLERELLGAERTLKRRDIAAGAGVSLLSARKLWRAMGFPNIGDDDIAFTEKDLGALTTIIDLVRQEQLTEDAAISITRAVGQMTDRMVVWQIEAIVEEMVAQRGLSDADARKTLVSELPDLIDPLEKTLVYAWRRQMNAAVQRLALRAESGLASSETGRAGDEQDAPLPLARAVGFADLVSYTSLSRQMNERTLAQLVQRFENKSAEIISVGGGRLVKTIGDEVLYIAESPEAGAEISLALAKAFSEDEFLPAARCSLVWGRVLSRLGDIYGPTVNLAARLTALAEPGEVLVDSGTAATLAANEKFVLTPHEPRQVRGFGEVQPVTLARGTGTGIVLD
ncbi:adenylate/guanylate cyclase domain-containing protein [Arthrobacter antioxidans]|uniref:adenylate/guanylate cyclase domain-containing protein n=1 Tax=Arthrobacter antioxidans TaxID=2895818 RepID=UPI003AF12410